MNPYLKNLTKIEFVVTNACTGRCRHCSEGEHIGCHEQIDPTLAANAVRRVAELYPIQTVMTFGGEPLLHQEAVYAIHCAAKEMQVPRRQIITNGYFTKDVGQMREVASKLAACGVNDLLLSVDAFHQETIPLDVVRTFAIEAKACGIPIRLQPAWLVSPTDQNVYNRETCKVLQSFADLQIPQNEGNIIFPEGNAKRFLSAYFVDTSPENPYAEDPRDVRCLSFSASGEILGGNFYKTDILEILQQYNPTETETI